MELYIVDIKAYINANSPEEALDKIKQRNVDDFQPRSKVIILHNKEIESAKDNIDVNGKVVGVIRPKYEKQEVLRIIT